MKNSNRKRNCWNADATCFLYFYWLQKYSLRLEQVWIFVTVFYRCKTDQKNYAKKMVKKHRLFFVFGCNMKSNGIVAAQHPKSTRKRRQIKKQQQGHLVHFGEAMHQLILFEIWSLTCWCETMKNNFLPSNLSSYWVDDLANYWFPRLPGLIVLLLVVFSGGWNR